MIMGLPKVQTWSRMMEPSEVDGSEIQPGPVIPNMASTWFTSPEVPKICFHRMATATEPPSRDGK